MASEKKREVKRKHRASGGSVRREAFGGVEPVEPDSHGAWLRAAMSEAVAAYPPGLAATHREAWVLAHVAGSVDVSYEEMMQLLAGIA